MKQFLLSDIHNLEHKHTVDMMQFLLSGTQNLDNKHIVGMIQFPLSNTHNLEHKHTIGVIQYHIVQYVYVLDFVYQKEGNCIITTFVYGGYILCITKRQAVSYLQYETVSRLQYVYVLART
jgi:hypothetical protein